MVVLNISLLISLLYLLVFKLFLYVFLCKSFFFLTKNLLYDRCWEVETSNTPNISQIGDICNYFTSSASDDDEELRHLPDPPIFSSSLIANQDDGM